MNFLLKDKLIEKFSNAAEKLPASFNDLKIFAVAGSGIISGLEKIRIIDEIPYSEINVLPEITVEGQRGKLIAGEINGIKTGIFTGRFHLYEGRAIEEILSPVLLSKALGGDNIIITNSAGGLNPTFRTGDIMLIADSINLTGKNIFTIFEIDKPAPPVIPGEIFNPVIREKCKEGMMNRAVDFREGITAQVNGPNYETPAEIRFLSWAGADAVGMSTVLESRCAALLGMNVAGCSFISNMLRDTHSMPLTHDEVLKNASLAEMKISGFFVAAIEAFLNF